MASNFTLAELVEKWVKPLETRLTLQRRLVNEYQGYYDGDHTPSFSTDGYKEEFNDFLNTIVDNWMPIVVDSVQERMQVNGFRFSDDGKGDSQAQDIWQANHLDAESELLHSSALIGGTASVLVWVDEAKADGDFPLITVEDPDQVYVLHGGPKRMDRLAAIKAWKDEWTGEERVNIYLPDAVYKVIQVGGRWQEFEKFRYRNPLGVVPIVPFYNRPKLKPGSFRSELKDVIATQKQINKILCDALVASEFSAYRQRWVTGMDVEIGEDGKPVNPFESGADRMFVATDSASEFGQFEATDLTNYVKMMENRIQSVASRTRTPAHYLLGNAGSFPSGESLKATETGLVAKVRQRMRFFGESWEEVMRLAFAVADDPKAKYFKAETIWADPESRTEAEHVDALVKLRTINVPIRQLWEDRGYTPTQIDRFLVWAREEALNASLAAPVTVVNRGVNGGTTEANSADDEA